MTLSDLIGSYDCEEIKKINIQVCNHLGDNLRDWTKHETKLVGVWWFDTEEKTLIILLNDE